MTPNPFARNLIPVIKKISPNALTLSAPGLIEDLGHRAVNLSENDVILPPGRFKQIEKDVLSNISKFDKKRRLPYHNVHHTQSVLRRTRQLMAHTNLSPGNRQLLQLGALFHDFRHGSLFSPSFNGRLSYEELSAIDADDYARGLGLTIKQRLALYGLIIGTTFSNPSIHPHTRMEKLLVIADLGGFTNSSRNWLVESMNVTLEIPIKHRPDTEATWLKEQLNFLAYVKKRLTAESRALKWDALLEQKHTLIRRLIQNPEFHRTYTPIVAKIRRMLPNAA